MATASMDLDRYRTALSRGARVCLGLALGFLGFVLWKIRHNPALGTDSLIYQLATPARWAQGESNPLDFPFHEGGVGNAPMLSQLLHYGLLKLTGDFSLSWLVQPAFFLLVLLIHWRSSRLLGVSRPLATVLTALLACFFPPFLQDLQIVNSDMILLAGTALMLYGLLLTRRAPQRGLIVAALGTALGLLTKTLAIFSVLVGWTLLLVPLWAVLKRVRQGERAGERAVESESAGESTGESTAESETPASDSAAAPASAALPDSASAAAHASAATPTSAARGDSSKQALASLLAVAAILALGLAFFWRSWVLHGNPLYPSQIKLLGVEVFAGRFDPAPLRDHGWAPSELGKLLWAGEGPHAITLPFALILWGALAGVALRFGKRARALGLRDWPSLSVTLLFPLGLTWIHFAQCPFWFEPRFLFPLWYALSLSLAFGLGRLAHSQPRGLGVLVPGCVVALFLALMLLLASDGAELLPFLAAGAVGALLWELEALKRYRLALVGLFALSFALSSLLWFDDYRAARAEARAPFHQLYYGERGEVWAWLGEREPLTISYAGSQITLPLHGSRLQHRVVYTPLSAEDKPPTFTLDDCPAECDPSWLWMYAKSAKVRRAKVDPHAWLAALDREQVDLLYLAADEWRGGVQQELDLVRRFPGRFKRLYHYKDVYLFRVLR